MVSGCSEIPDPDDPDTYILLPRGNQNGSDYIVNNVSYDWFESVRSKYCYNSNKINCVFSSNTGSFAYTTINSENVLRYKLTTAGNGNISTTCCYVGTCTDSWCHDYQQCDQTWCESNGGSWNGTECKTPASGA